MARYSHYTPVSSQALTLCKIVIALAIVGAIGFLVARKPRDRKVTPAPNDPPAATIKAATAHFGDIGYYLDALGTVTPVATVNVYSQVNGAVIAVHYTEGQMVHRGDPLIDIDPRPYEAQLQQAEGTLEHDRGVLAQAEMDLARYEQALAQQAISQQTYDGWDTTQLPSEKMVAVKKNVSAN